MGTTWIGLIAGTLTSIAAIPQLIKTITSHQARDISIWQPLLLSIGVALWLLYGIMIHDIPLILANIIPLACNLALTLLKIRYSSTEKENTLFVP